MNCRDCPVHRRSLFADLPPDELLRLQHEKNQITVEGKPTPIFTQGEQVRGLYCLGSVRAKVTEARSLPGEGERLVRIARPGDTVGHRSIFIQSKYKGTALPIESGSYCHIPSDVVLRLLGSQSSFALGLMSKMARELSVIESRNAALHEKNVRERLAEVLTDLAREHGVGLDDGSIRIDVALKREEMAELVGAAEENIIRLLAEFKSEGLVRETAKRLHVVSMDRLSALSVGQIGR